MPRNEIIPGDYNRRLFSGGIRARVHETRFRWLTQTLLALNFYPESVIELGCFDAKTVNFLPQMPKRYVGLDACWEGGLDSAEQIWKNHENFNFIYCSKPEEIDLQEQFDLSICMETLEHIEETFVEPYLQKLAALTSQYILITVPNEKGVVFALKHLFKCLTRYEHESYTFGEFANACLGRLHKVARHQHKGFDYDQLISIIAKYFEIKQVAALPFGKVLPSWLGYNIGIVAKKR